MSKTALVYKTAEVAMMIDKPVTTVTNEIRKGHIKATKVGKEYLIEKREIDRYLGIETNDESLKKDLKIKELEVKIKSYEIQMQALKGIIGSLESVMDM